VTLLFIITKEPIDMPWLSLIGVLFVVSALVAVVSMSVDFPQSAIPFAKVIELVPFTMALFLVAVWFYMVARQVSPYEYLIWFIGVYAVIGGVILALLDRRRRKREVPTGVV